MLYIKTDYLALISLDMIRIAIKPILFILYYFLYLVPRTNKIWLFGSGSGHSFSDNAKYLFLYSSNIDDVKCFWISKNKQLVKNLRVDGRRAYYAYSLMGLWLSIISNVYIYDGRANGINFWTSFGAYHINLWHGSPLKKLDRDINLENSDFFKGYYGRFLEKLSIRFSMPEWFTISDLIIATSEKPKNYLQTAFGIDNVIVSGYPRNDVIIDHSLGCSFFSDDSIQFQKVILYSPTFRDTNTDNTQVSIDWERLNDLLLKENAIFYLKLHRHDKSIVIDKGYTNIKVLNNDVDVYPMFKDVDLLITDYSSIFFDFLLTDKPILFYSYDKESYLNNDRPMYDDYDSVTPGYKVLDFEQLYVKLELFFKNPKSLKEVDVYNKIKDLYHKYKDAKGSERTYKYIKEMLKI
jgi:CDP-glycerol glycerophosphotransferase (TagB/SpsB family)